MTPAAWRTWAAAARTTGAVVGGFAVARSAMIALALVAPGGRARGLALAVGLVLPGWIAATCALLVGRSARRVWATSAAVTALFGLAGLAAKAAFPD